MSQEVKRNNMADLNTDNALFQFLQNIQLKTLFQQDEEKIKDLEKGVKGIIQNMIDVFYADSKYDFEELIHVGSSYEGSKIIAPNEFDFMLVLKDLSQPGKVYIEPGCQPGMKLVRYKQFERSNSSGPNLVLNNILGLEMDSVMTSSDTKRGKQKEIRVKTSLGELRIKNMLRYTLHLECVNHESDFDITVDLMPSVRLPADCKEIMKDMTTCPSYIRDLAFRDGCFVVGKFCIIDGMCWQLSFAAAERNMMKSLSPGHIKIYRVLKYVFVEKSIIGICDLMSSYVLKTAVLRHAYFGCDENMKSTGCFVTILRSIATSMASAFMKSLFIPSLNLWQKVIHEKMRNITENDTICDKSVKEQLANVITTEGKELKDALTVTVIFDFWRRIFLLLAEVFESADDGALKSNAMENVLRAIYTKLNEEVEENDIDEYFKQEKTGNKASHGTDWQISRSLTKSSINVVSETKNFIPVQLQENRIVNVDEDNTSASVMGKVDDENIESEKESQDLKDIEQFVNYYVEETGENFDSEDESFADTNDDDDDCEDSEDEMFVQADQEDVYELYAKYRAQIIAANIPVFSDLLKDFSKIEPSMSIQNIVERFNACQRTSDSPDHTESVKRQKLDDN